MIILTFRNCFVINPGTIIKAHDVTELNVWKCLKFFLLLKTQQFTILFMILKLFIKQLVKKKINKKKC